MAKTIASQYQVNITVTERASPVTSSGGEGMSESSIDRIRAQRLMQRAGLDALLLLQPEHVAYAIGVHPGPASLFRRAGAAAVLVPSDPSEGIAAVLPDLAAGAVRRGCGASRIDFHTTWVESGTARPHRADESLQEILGPPAVAARPATLDPMTAFGLIAAQLGLLGLDRGRIGVDFGFVPAADAERLAAALPHAELVDGTDTIQRLRMVKTGREIEKLRLAASLSEAGYRRALSGVRAGIERPALSRLYRDGVEEQARHRGATYSGTWDYISIGPDPWGAGKPAEPGDVIKFDVGVVIDGYSSDFARTVCLGASSRAAAELHGALLAGLEAGLAMLRPGTPLSEIHALMRETIIGHGVPHYARGHFGHGLGNDPFSEQWPFIAADSDVMAEPGMVLAVEAPHYVDGLGGFIVEDQLIVTEDGIALMTFSPRAFQNL